MVRQGGRSRHICMLRRELGAVSIISDLIRSMQGKEELLANDTLNERKPGSEAYVGDKCQDLNLGTFSTYLQVQQQSPSPQVELLLLLHKRSRTETVESEHCPSLTVTSISRLDLLILTSLPSALYGEKCSESLIPFGAAMLTFRSSKVNGHKKCRASEGLHRFC